MTFSISTTIKLYDTDASGFIFYGALCRLTQECFEAFLKKHDLPIERWVSGDLPGLPVRKFEGEYLAPLQVGEEVRVAISSLEIGTSSLLVSFSVRAARSETECVTARITHVAIDRKSAQVLPLPAVARVLEVRG